MLRRIATLSTLLMALGCGTEDPRALDEPLVVHQADFKEGALPGGAQAAEPKVTSFTLGFGVLRPGTRNAPISGRSTKSAYSIGIRFQDVGGGYWVRPVGSEDPLIPGELQWQLSLDAASEIVPGVHPLEVVAFDADGKPGEKSVLPVCVASDLPDNLNVCNPAIAPPLAIASLSWNTDSDLDLTIVAPDGTTYGRSKRSLSANGKVIARIDGDGVSGCLADGRRRESFVWNEPPPAGVWRIYGDLFDACGKPATTFTLTMYQRVQQPDGTFGIAPVKELTGQFVRAQASAGGASPLFLSEITF